MDSKTKTPFQLFFSPKQWCQRRCLSQFVLISVLISFWCSTHNFDFFVINDVGGYCPLDSVQDFSSVFRFFVFSFPPPVFHCCAGGQDISCTVFAQSEIAKDSFCACLQFPPNAHCFQLYPAKHFDQRSGFLFLWLQLHCPASKLLTGQEVFFAISALIQFAGSSQFRFELKLRFSENHFPTSVTLPTITPHRHGFEEFGFGLWKFLSRHSDMMGLNSEIFSFKLSQSYVMVFNSNNYSLKLSCTCNC